MKVALIGGVSSSEAALDGLVQSGVPIASVCGVDEAQATVISDYRSLRGRAESAGVPFLPFLKVTESRVRDFLVSHPADALWVVGLSQLVPLDLLKLFPQGGVGFHPTMLPEGRGRAPVAWTILKGTRAAVNLFRLTSEADAGDIIIQREVPVLPDDYSEDLIARTNKVLIAAISELAPILRGPGPVPATPQDHSKATHWGRRTHADGRIDWHESNDMLHRLVRAAGRPYSGAFTSREGEMIVVWRARPEPRRKHARPGAVLDLSAAGEPLVACGVGALCLEEVSLEGGGACSLASGQYLGEG